MVILIFFLLLIFLLMVFLEFSMLWSSISGAPYIFSRKETLCKAFDLAELRKGDLIVDLGCGNARSLILAAKEFGANGIGVERSPYAYFTSKLNVILSGQSKKIKILFGDFSVADKYLKKSDLLYLYLYPPIIKKRENWFFENIGKQTKIISLSFPFANHKPSKTIEALNLGQKTKIYLYRKN